MKKLRLIAVGAALALSSTMAAAQAPQATQPNTAQDDKAYGKHGKHDRDGEMGRGRMKGGDNRARRALFQGVKLTDAQKPQVRAIGEKYRAERQALAKQAHDRREADQKPDSAFMAGMRTQHEQIMQREAAEIRAILTAEQRTAFDANVTRMKEHAGQHREKRREGRGGRRG